MKSFKEIIENTFEKNQSIYKRILKDFYPSCKTCSKYISDSNLLSQNCIECKESYLTAKITKNYNTIIDNNN